MIVAVNTYAERLEGQVVVWLVVSQLDGTIFAMTLDPADASLLIDALKRALADANALVPS